MDRQKPQPNLAEKRSRLQDFAVHEMPARITQLVDGESERGAILILAAYLEELVGELIRASCISDEKADGLLEFRRPAGDFDSKITLCNALGMLHDAEAAGLNAVRRIRNSAAHFDKKGRGFDVLFDSNQTMDLVGNLAEAMNLGRPEREREAVFAMFVISCRLLATKIMFRIIEAERPPIPRTLKEVANDIRAAAKGTELEKHMAEVESLLHNGDFDQVGRHLKEMASRIRSRVGQSTTAETPVGLVESESGGSPSEAADGNVSRKQPKR
jgi:hypothetical protein